MKMNIADAANIVAAVFVNVNADVAEASVIGNAACLWKVVLLLLMALVLLLGAAWHAIGGDGGVVVVTIAISMLILVLLLLFLLLLALLLFVFLSSCSCCGFLIVCCGDMFRVLLLYSFPLEVQQQYQRCEQ